MQNIEKSKKELLKELQNLQNENEFLKLAYQKNSMNYIRTESNIARSGEKISTLTDPIDQAISLPDEQTIRQLFDDYLAMYSSRDDLLTNHFSENFSGFTGGGDFLVKNKEEWVAITRQDFDQVKDPIKIELKDVAIQPLAETVAVATGFFKIHLPIKDHILSKETARLVLIFNKESQGWKISHSSISIPYYLVREGEVYPMQELIDRNQLLEKLVTERTNQLSEVNDNLQQANNKLTREISKHKQTEEALQKSEQKYHLLVDKANEAIVVVQGGLLQLANPMTVTMTGYSVEELESLPFQTFVHPEDRQRLVDNYQRRIQGQDIPSYYVFRLLKKDGDTRWVYMSAALIEWEGNPATLNFLTDITELKLIRDALQETNQKWEAVIAASPDGIGMISLDGKIKLISDKLVSMHGYPTEIINQFLGRSIFDFIDPSSHDLLIENTRKLLGGENGHNVTEYLALKKDNSRFYIEVKASVINDSNGNPASILYVERDITERKRNEKELVQKNLELAELNATKDKFFSIIAHDLKSPFQGLLGYSQILSTEYSTLTEEEKISFIASIEDLSQSSYKLLENLLEWSRIQTGQMNVNLETFNLLVDLFPTLSLVKQTAKNKNINFHYSIDNSIFVNADKNMLSAIVRNLISNSIKFTEPGGSITISTRKLDNLVEISVTDTGIGIDKENLGKLFRIDKNISTKGTANEEGTGLGLILCKEMIEKNGGKIRVESEVGKGSTFAFTIQSFI